MTKLTEYQMNIRFLKKLIVGLVFSVSAISSIANAGLIDRGNGMIYDDVMDITWLQDANYAQTSGYDADGKMTWNESMEWAAQLTFGGYDDWRLTKIYDMNNDGCNNGFTGTDCGYNVLTSYTELTNGNVFFSELAYMYYENLSNLAYYDESGNGPQIGWDTLNANFVDSLTNEIVGFANINSKVHWSGTEYVDDTNYAMNFAFSSGFQAFDQKISNWNAWAVRDGDVGGASVSVSEPSTFAILAIGLLGLVARRIKK